MVILVAPTAEDDRVRRTRHERVQPVSHVVIVVAEHGCRVARIREAFAVMNQRCAALRGVFARVRIMHLDAAANRIANVVEPRLGPQFLALD